MFILGACPSAGRDLELIVCIMKSSLPMWVPKLSSAEDTLNLCGCRQDLCQVYGVLYCMCVCVYTHRSWACHVCVCWQTRRHACPHTNRHPPSCGTVWACRIPEHRSPVRRRLISLCQERTITMRNFSKSA